MQARTFKTLLLVLFLASAIGRTGSAVAAADTAQAVSHRSPGDNVLRFGVHVSKMGKLDPHFAAGSQDRAMADMVFNGLLRYVPGDAPKIEPDLAVAVPGFKMVDGRQVWTVKLRKGVMFHPGPAFAAYEMTADDVVYSLKKSADRELCSYAGEYAGMAVEKVDTYTVSISVAKPISSILFLPKLTNYGGGFIVSKKAIENMGYEQFKSHPVGTGPFVFHSYTQGGKLVLKANEHYFRGRPLLDGVEMHFISDGAQRGADFLSGKLDVIMASGDKGWIENMSQQPNVKVDVHGVGEVSTIYFNTRMKPMDDVRVRRAIAYALDRKAFLFTTNRRIADNVYSQVPVQFLPGGLTFEEVRSLDLDYPANRDKARQLLSEAGYPEGFTLDLVSSEKRIYRSCYDLLRQQLARVGIDCRVYVVGHSEMHKTIRREFKPIVFYIAWRPNADAYLSRFFHSDSTIVTGARPDTNFAQYNRIDTLIEDARLEIQPEKQINLWKQAQIRILSDMAAFPIMFTRQCFVRRDSVDYGHRLVSTMALYPQFTEKTRLTAKR